jgi:hypothetical protein
MTNSGADYEVKLPYDDVLLPWALKHDPEVARIILAVQAKALRNSNSDAYQATVPVKSVPADSKELSQSVTKIEVQQNQQVTGPAKTARGRRRKHANAAEKQKAYRSRLNVSA